MEGTKKPSTANARTTAHAVKKILVAAGLPISQGPWHRGYIVCKIERMVGIAYDAGLTADDDRTAWRARLDSAKAFLEDHGYEFVPGMMWIACDK